MNNEQRRFMRQLAHRAINSGVRSIMWRMPTLMLVVVIAALIGAVWYWELW